jgi:hypothetical protein
MRFEERLQAVMNMKGSVNLLISWKAFDQRSNNFDKKVGRKRGITRSFSSRLNMNTILRSLSDF